METIEFIDATAELKEYNRRSKSKKVIPEFWSNKGTKNMILYLKEKLQLPFVYKCVKGKGGGTWMHPELFIYFKNWLYKIPNKTFSRDEIEFASAIQTAFLDVYEFTPQKNFGQYFVDLYCEELRLCIEFDEKYHNSRVEIDTKRQAEISNTFGVSFLRHKSKDNMFVFINRVIKFVKSKG